MSPAVNFLVTAFGLIVGIPNPFGGATEASLINNRIILDDLPCHDANGQASLYAFSVGKPEASLSFIFSHHLTRLYCHTSKILKEKSPTPINLSFSNIRSICSGFCSVKYFLLKPYPNILALYETNLILLSLRMNICSRLYSSFSKGFEVIYAWILCLQLGK